MIDAAEMARIERGYKNGLTKASFGGVRGECVVTGATAGMTLYLCQDEGQVEDDFKSGEAFPFTVDAYRSFKIRMHGLTPPPPPVNTRKIVLPVPNGVTAETFAKTDRGEEVVKSASPEEMFEKLGV